MFKKIISFFKILALILVIDFVFIIITNHTYCDSCLGSPEFYSFLKWKFSRNIPTNWPELEKKNHTPKASLPTLTSKNEIAITYINHATVLIQTEKANIITDPIWSEFAGPFGKFGSKRHAYPGINISDLPKIDFILISHSHYDHLDNPSISMLTKDHHPILLTGLGNSRYIDYCKNHPDKCIELDWWENKKFDDISINYVPSYHWSSRYLIDKNTSLWGGFVVQAPENKNIYFPGDTSFADGQYFHAIKNKFKEIYISLLPIGAYKPEWFFSNMHIGPYQAVEISKILDSKYTIPIHYDVFMLTDDEYSEPLTELEKTLSNCNNCNSEFKILGLGKTFTVK